jgi:glycosyltransferase involved in cell wall biosynthesis
VSWLDWNGADEALAAWAGPRYDVVWFSHCHTWLGLGGVAIGPVIVDFDNLEDEKLRTLIDLRRRGGGDTSDRPKARALVAAQLDRIDLGRWRRAQRRAAAAARVVVVCSELDRERLGVDQAVVIPNGYEAPGGDAPTSAPADPVLTMVGLFVYQPNLDAAKFFAENALPLVRREIPAARFRIVGRHDGLLDGLRRYEGVDVVGEVASLDACFRTTTAVVIPVRAGSGTRIKVLEAFARRRPVVSTRLGSEGIGARDGLELLNADTPRELADACIRVLRDPELAASLAEAGHKLWAAEYRADAIRTRVAELAARVADS